jgi:transposase InsO family protein
MEVRLAVAAFEAVDAGGDGTANVSAVCRELGISRDSFYRYRARVEVEGFAGLLPRSSRPRTSPNQTSPEVVSAIVAARARLIEQGWDHGARSIQFRLVRAKVAVPSARTVHRVLVRQGLIEPAPAKRPRSSFHRFEHPAPNGCWQLDGTEWALADGSPVCILRLVDDHSRLILATRAVPAETTEHAWALMETALARHGRPVMLLSDGGSAFTSRRTTGGISVFEQRVRDQGINPVVSSPRHPQTCGKKERDWQPLKRWLAAHPAARDRSELQRLLDCYDVLFNTERPHQGINGATPAERYHASAKARPHPGPRPAPVSYKNKPVRPGGAVELGNKFRVNIGHQWTGATVTVVRDNLDVAILHDGKLIKRLVIDPDRRIQVSGLKLGRPPTRLQSETS